MLVGGLDVDVKRGKETDTLRMHRHRHLQCASACHLAVIPKPEQDTADHTEISCITHQDQSTETYGRWHKGFPTNKVTDVWPKSPWERGVWMGTSAWVMARS